MTAPTRIVTARRDPRLTATVASLVPLRYAAGADDREDRPAHVRAGSALARIGGRLAVVQDDAAFVALLDSGGGRVEAIPLPHAPGGQRQFDDTRGNKGFKLDLEACIVLPAAEGHRLLALGSGSSPARERIVDLLLGRDGTRTVRLRDASAWYARLRACGDFAGSELNLEGATLPAPGLVRLFQRGNGAPRGGRRAVDATGDIALDALLAHLEDPNRQPPLPTGMVEYRLGELGGTRLTFTDAAAVAGGAALYLAVAEESPDAIRDGPVRGCALGVIDDRGEARWTPLVDVAGHAFAGKAEGLSPDPTDPRRGFVVVDRDDPAAPCELGEVRLDGPWFE